MKNRKLVWSVVGVALLVAAMLAVYGMARPETNSGGKAFVVEVVHSDKTSKEFTYQTEELYVGACLLSEGLIDGDEGPYGLYIKEVDGESAVYEVDQSYWAFYENGEYASTGIDQTPIDAGDRFALIYTAG